MSHNPELPEAVSEEPDNRIPVPSFTIEVEKQKAAFQPHPQAAQCFTLVQKSSGWSHVWTHFHIIQDFHNYKLSNKKHFKHYQPENKAISPFWAAYNICGGIILAKPHNLPWTGGGMIKHLEIKHGIIDPKKGKKKPAVANLKTSMEEKRKYQLEKVCKWVAKNNVPMSMIESTAFREMLTAFDNTAPVFTSRVIRNKMRELDGVVSNKL